MSRLLIQFAFFILICSHVHASPEDFSALSIGYGKHILAEYDLPTSKINSLNDFILNSEKNTSAAKPSVQDINKEWWSTPTLTLYSNQGPYVVVLTVFGNAKNNGPVNTSWELAFKGDEDRVKKASIHSLGERNASAGEMLMLTGPSTLLNIDSGIIGELHLGVGNIENISVKAVHVAVVGKSASRSWAVFFNFFGILITFIVVMWLIRKLLRGLWRG